MVKYLQYILFLMIFPLHSVCAEDDGPEEMACRAQYHYENGDYALATPLFLKALKMGDMTYATSYADICYRGLDPDGYRPKEAAQWYVKAADAGDADALSFLNSLSETLIGLGDESTKIQELIHVWGQADANEGFEHYRAGEYQDAAEYLEKASLAYHPFAQRLYADICLRQLDDKPHSYMEAAMWYLLAALGGDSQSYSYLKSIVPSVLNDDDYESQAKAIAQYWVLVKSLEEFTKKTPKSIADYTMAQSGEKVGKVIAVKRPYIFERAMSTVMVDLMVSALSVFAKDEETHSRVLPCAFEEPLLFLNEPGVPWQFGWVNRSYYMSLGERLDDDMMLSAPRDESNFSLSLKLLLDSICHVTGDWRASELTDLSHKDPPWMLAGIKYWKAHNGGQEFNVTSFAEAELIEKLESFNKLDEETTQAILDAVEDKNIWPNSNHSDPVCSDYDALMREYFKSSLSRENQDIQAIKNDFMHKLYHETHQIVCSSSSGLNDLKDPFLMYFSQRIELLDVPSTRKFYNALRVGQQYCVDMELIVCLSPDFDKNKKIGKHILNIFRELKRRGIILAGILQDGETN